VLYGELGPGNGDQTFHFKASIFEKIYGAEPNVNFHQTLTSKAKEAGFDGNYIPFKAGPQPESLLPALQDAGVLPPKMTQLPDGGIVWFDRGNQVNVFGTTGPFAGDNGGDKAAVEARWAFSVLWAPAERRQLLHTMLCLDAQFLSMAGSIERLPVGWQAGKGG
jgi:hypothetical protein